ALVPAAPTRAVRLEEVDLCTTLGTAHGVLGRFDEARATLTRSAQVALDYHDPTGACRAYRNLVALTYDGDACLTHARAGLAVARANGLRPDEKWFLMAIAWEEIERGTFEEAERRLDEADAIASAGVGRLIVQSDRGRLALARGMFGKA